MYDKNTNQNRLSKADFLKGLCLNFFTTEEEEWKPWVTNIVLQEVENNQVGLPRK